LKDKKVKTVKSNGDSEDDTHPSRKELEGAVKTLSYGFDRYESLIALPKLHIKYLKEAMEKIQVVKRNLDCYRRTRDVCDNACKYVLIKAQNMKADLEGKIERFAEDRAQLIISSKDAKDEKAKEKFRKDIGDIRKKKTEWEFQIEDLNTFIESLKTENFEGTFDVSYDSDFDIDTPQRTVVIQWKLNKFTLIYRLTKHEFLYNAKNADDEDELIDQVRGLQYAENFITDHSITIEINDKKDDDRIHVFELPEDGACKGGELILKYEGKTDANGGFDAIAMGQGVFPLLGLNDEDFFSVFVGMFIRECYDLICKYIVSYEDYADKDEDPTLAGRRFDKDYQDPDDPDYCE